MKELVIDVMVLDRECAVFCRYLIGSEPNHYVKKKYREAHQIGLLAPCDRSNACESFLVQAAAIGPLTTKIMDAYARVFHPSSRLRKKLILLLAILENCAYSHLDSVDSKSKPLWVLAFLRQGLTFALFVTLAAFLLLPLELMVRGFAKIRYRRSTAAWIEWRL